MDATPPSATLAEGASVVVVVREGLAVDLDQNELSPSMNAPIGCNL